MGPSVASFTKQVNPRLAKCPLKTNGRLANLELASSVKEATGSKPLSEAMLTQNYLHLSQCNFTEGMLTKIII